MRKTFLMIPALLLTMQVFAQSDRVTSAWNNLKYNELEKGKENINKAIKHEDTKNEAKTWFYRGNIYFAIDTSTNPDFKKLSNNPKDKVIESYKRCSELDEAGRYKTNNKMVENVIKTGIQLFNAGAQDYNKALKTKRGADTGLSVKDSLAMIEDFKKSLTHFENHFTSKELAGKYSQYIKSNMEKAGIDPKKPFLFAGYSAFQIGEYQKAKKYLRELVKGDSDKERAYLFLSDVYLETGDTTKALGVIDSGRKEMPGNESLQTRMLRIYQQSGNVEKLIENLESSIEANPEELQLYRVLAGTYENLSKEEREKGNAEKAQEYKDKAKNTYGRLLEKFPYNFKANYNLGIMYYNIGVDKYQEASEVEDSEKIMKLQEEGGEQFEKAVPYLEKAFYKNCGDDDLFSSLKNVYQRTNQTKELKAIKEARKDNNQVTVNIQGSTGQMGTVTVTHSGETVKYENVSFSDEEGSYLGWDTDICPQGGKVKVEVKVTKGSEKVSTTIYQMGEEQMNTEKKEFSYSVK